MNSFSSVWTRQQFKHLKQTNTPIECSSVVTTDANGLINQATHPANDSDMLTKQIKIIRGCEFCMTKK